MNKPYLNTDGYKVGHAMLYPKGTQFVYETLVPRDNTYFPWDDKMVVFGYEYFVYKLVKDWSVNFFDKPWEQLEPDFKIIRSMFGTENVYKEMVRRFKALHEHQRLPIEIKLLPEGSLVPMRVPVFTIKNTHPDFFWLPGYLETTLLANTFVTSTNASIARQFRKIGDIYAELTADSKDFLDFQFHDFSQRGQHGDQAAVLSGLAHLTSFNGTDVIPAVVEARDIWGEEVGGTILATEHSVMEAYGTDQEEAYEQLLAENPNGILSVVSDTYDYWEVIDEVLPALYDNIMRREGKLVIRLDSLAEERKDHDRIETPQQLVVETLKALWETFGGTTNSKGFKVLDSHVGVLHGKGVTLDNIELFMKDIKEAGFSTENVVFGIGAYNYSLMSSRDSFGQALKASVAIINGVEKHIFKKPKSEAEAFKASPKGAVIVKGESSSYEVVDRLTIEEAELSDENQLKLFFKDGWLVRPTTSILQVRDRIKGELYK